MKLYIITEEERDNWLALFKEVQINGENRSLRGWWLGEQAMIEQSIDELEALEPIEEE